MKKDPLILVRGGGDLATGTIHRLWSAGLRVLVLEAEHPAAIRRQVSLCEAVYEGETAVEGLRAVRIETLAQAEEVWKQNAVPVLVDPQGKSIAPAKPDVLVDAILAKKNLGTTRDMLDERLLNTPAVAVERARSATADMAELARVGVVQAMSLTHQWNDELAQKVRDEESTVDRYEDALGTYLVKLSGRELSHADSQSVNTLLHTISDFERISDHSVNLLESAEEMHQKNIEFSKDAQEELQVLEDAVQDILSRTTDAFRKGDLHLASKVEPLEAVVNELVRAIKAHHIARLQTGSCSIEYGFVLDDLLTNYERVCDHCSNVAVAQIEVAQDSFDTHAYLNDLRHGKDTKESEEFHRRLDKYRERYLFPDNQSAEEFDK